LELKSEFGKKEKKIENKKKKKKGKGKPRLGRVLLGRPIPLTRAAQTSSFHRASTTGPHRAASLSHFSSSFHWFAWPACQSAISARTHHFSLARGLHLDDTVDLPCRVQENRRLAVKSAVATSPTSPRDKYRVNLPSPRP
jgi:hypothetical protein